MPNFKKFDLSDFKFDCHPGGQSHLDAARNHARADLLFLSYHLGCNLNAIAAAAKTRGVKLPKDVDSVLYTELSAIVANLRSDRNLHILIYRVYCLIVTAMLPITLAIYIVTLSTISAVIFCSLLTTYAFNIFHMRFHMGGRLYSSGVNDSHPLLRMLDSITAPLYQCIDEIFMVTPQHWIKQHQASHHVFTNSASDDYDVTKPYPILRLHNDFEWRWYHVYQSLYAPFALTLNGFSFAYENYFLKGGRLIYLLTHIGLMIVLPAYFNGLGSALLAYLLVTGTVSLVTAYCFQISHNACTVMRSEQTLRLDDVSYDEWIQQQVEESISYGGYLTTLFFGGINLQTEHHVAPAMEPTLLHFFRYDLEQISISRGFCYRFLPSASTAVVEYHQRLTELGQPFTQN